MRKEGVRRGGGWALVLVVGMLFWGSEALGVLCGDNVCDYGPPFYEEVTCLSDCDGCNAGSPDSCGGFSYDADGVCGCDANCWNASNLYGDCCPNSCAVCSFGCTGACGNGTCGPGEDGTNCAADCGCAPTPAICGTTTEARDPDCRCDALCLRYGDCCADVCTACSGICVGSGTCGNGTCDPNERAQTCAADCGCQAAGMCGRQAPDGCWCDSLCLLIGDCCADACTRCSRCENACGDGDCTGSETCVSCAADCDACLEQCGNAVCGPGESCSICPADCGACGGSCPNGTCGPGETCSNCSADCGACAVCGSGGCQAGENCTNCPVDCGPCAVCGNAICEPGENCVTCAQDCGSGTNAWVSSLAGAFDATVPPKIAMSGSSIYVVATFSGCVSSVCSAGGNDILLAKFDDTGASQWIKRMGSNSASPGDKGFDVAVASDGSVFVTGMTDSGDTYFGQGEANQTYFWSSGGDGFIAKFSPVTGNLNWAKQFGYASPSYSEGRSLATTTMSEVVITGAWSGTVTFGEGGPQTTLIATATTSSDYNGFLAKYNAAGGLVNAKSILAGNTVGHGHGRAVATDSADNFFVGGVFAGNVTIGGVPVSQNYTSTGGDDMFVAKFNGLGDMQWSKVAGGAGTDTVQDVGVSSVGDVRIVGTWSGASSTFGTGDPGVITFDSAGVSDAFIAGYSPIGAFTFARSIDQGTDGGATGETGLGIALKSDATSFFVSGAHTGSTPFGVSTAAQLASPQITIPGPAAGAPAAYFANYNGNGTLAWADWADAGQATGVALHCDGSPRFVGLSATKFFMRALTTPLTTPGSLFIAKPPSEPSIPTCGDYVCGPGECKTCPLDCAPAPSDCNMDGDGLPPTVCTGPYPGPADDVRCVCPGGGDCDGAATTCDASYTTIGAAFTALPSTVSMPTYISIYAGTYTGAINLTGKTVTGSLWIGARCQGTTREAVIVNTAGASGYLFRINIDNVTLEGMKLDLTTENANAVRIACSSSTAQADNPKLRYLSIANGNGSMKYIQLDSCSSYPITGFLMEEVDIFAGATGLTNGISMADAPGYVIRRTSICPLVNTAGRGIDTSSAGGTIERTLIKNFRALNGWGVILGGPASGTIIDGVISRDNYYFGSYAPGLTIRNSRLLGGQNPLGFEYAGVTTITDIFNNLIGRGGNETNLKISGNNPALARLAWNTFFGPTNAAGQIDLWSVTTNEFRANLMLDHNSNPAVRRNSSPMATTYSENRYYNNTAGNCTCTGSPCGSATECLDGSAPTTQNPQAVQALSGWKYYLNQATSPAVNASAALASAQCSGSSCLSSMTTATNAAECQAAVLDTGQADLGFHYPACTCEPYEHCSDGVDNDGNGLIDDGCTAEVLPTGLAGSGSSGQDGATCFATYTFPTVVGHTYTVSTCNSFTGYPWVGVTGSCVCSNKDGCPGNVGATCTCVANTTGTATICASTGWVLSATWSYDVTREYP